MNTDNSFIQNQTKAWQNAYSALKQMETTNKSFSGYTQAPLINNFGYGNFNLAAVSNYYRLPNQSAKVQPTPAPVLSTPYYNGYKYAVPLPPNSPPIIPPPPPPPEDLSPPIITIPTAPLHDSKPIRFNLPKRQPLLKTPVCSREPWSSPLKDYARRAFDKYDTESEKNQVQSILKEKLIKAQEDEMLYNTDWSKEPLPEIAPPKIERDLSKFNNSSQINNFPQRQPSFDFANSHAGKVNESTKFKPKRKNNKIEKSKNKRAKAMNTNINMNMNSLPEFIPISTKAVVKNNKFEAPLVTKEMLDKRAARFQNERNPIIASPPTLSPDDACEDMDLDSYNVVGTCQDLEKRYLRLTSAPHASTIRPPAVLVNSLERMKEDWRVSKDYEYVCDQLKSIRQDLTLQGIRDELAINVYETHARIALEKGHHHEFNQCQIQLAALHADIGVKCHLEFTGYRILYYIFTNNILDLNIALNNLCSSDKLDPVVSFALRVREAWSLGNYRRFFKLFQVPPMMSGYLLDLFVSRERKAALKVILRSYRPSVPLSFVLKELAFQTENDCREFLSDLGIAISGSNHIDCKQTISVVTTTEK